LALLKREGEKVKGTVKSFYLWKEPSWGGFGIFLSWERSSEGGL
jgi:hypothetical protein